MRRLAALTIIILAINTAALATWEAQTSGTTKQLNGVFTSDETTAVAVGNDRVIIKTTDYGANWVAKKAELANRDLNAVHFPSASIGYVAGHNAGNNWAYILKSTDAGESWDDNLDGTTDALALNDIFFVNDSTGWACGTISSNVPIIYTTDGGTVWNNIGAGAGKPGAYPYEGIFFLDSSTGWVVGGDGSSGGRIYKTADGGTNWTAQSYPDPKNADILNDVYFINATTGWIAADVHDFGAGGARGMILKTTDGGSNWSAINSGSIGHIEQLDFIDANNGWACAAGNAMEVIKTTDGGVTPWSQELYNLGATGLNGIDVIDAYNGWAVGQNGNIFRNNADPTITSIDPSTANQGDTNLAVTLQGTNFLTGLATTSVTFSLSGITVNSLTRDSDSQISLLISVTTTGATGIGNLTLTNPDLGSVTETNAFSVNPVGVTPPIVTSVLPDAGGQNADMTVIINGSNFHTTPTPEVYFRNGGITVNSISSLTATAITCNITISASAVTTWRGVTVTNTDDSGIGSKNNAFKVNSAPSILTVTERPRTSAAGYTDTITSYLVTGLYFQTGATASFTPADITATVTVNDSQNLILDVTIPTTATLGDHTLTITNPDFGYTSLASALTVNQQTTNATVVQNRCLAGPNPWNPLTGPVTLQFYLTKATQIKLTLFTMSGEKLSEMILSGVAGYNTTTWSGLSFTGHSVPEGIFLVNIIDMTRGTTLGNIKVMVHRYLP